MSYDDESHLRRLEQAARIALRPPGADPSHLVPLGRVEPVARRLAALPPERLQPVLDEADAYTAQLDLLGLADRDVVPGNTQPRLQQRLNRSATVIVVLAPLAALGAGVNLPPLAVVRVVSRRPMARISRGNMLMLASIVSFPLTWLCWGLLARRRLRHPWRAALVAGPLGGYAALGVLGAARPGAPRQAAVAPGAPFHRSARRLAGAADGGGAGGRRRAGRSRPIAHGIRGAWTVAPSGGVRNARTASAAMKA